MNNYKKLNVWSESHALTVRIYSATSNFPKNELYGLTSQIRRASMSIPCNIAEGSSRDSDRDFHRFLEIAHGSGLELEYLLLLSHDLGYFDKATYVELNGSIVSILKQLFFLRRSLK
jgi:four helix bundle protein